MSEKLQSWNDLADEYTKYGKRAVTDWVLGYHKVYSLIAPLVGKRVLDYGCGDGKFSRYLSLRGAEVRGVDISPKMVEAAQENSPEDIDFSTMNRFEDISNRFSESFDYVLAMFVTSQLEDEKELLHVFSQAYSVLKPGGKFVILNGNWETGKGKQFISYSFEPVENLVSGMEVSVSVPGAELSVIKDRYWSTKQYRELFQTSGFKHIETMEPLADNDMYHWKDERQFAPLLIMSATK